MKPLHEDSWRYIEYLNFKMQCAADQERLKWKVDVPKAEALLETLETIEQEKHKELVKFMPKKVIFKAVNRPKVMHQKDGTLPTVLSSRLHVKKTASQRTYRPLM
jgi:NMD protein affecting ribosome stability and mRNA decay